MARRSAPRPELDLPARGSGFSGSVLTGVARGLVAVPLCLGIALACSAPDGAEGGGGWSDGLAGYGALAPARAGLSGVYARVEPTVSDFRDPATGSSAKFNQVRDILLLPAKDLVVVADGGDAALRFFDMAGRLRYSAGRPGEGPGEFRDLRRLWEYGGDSLLTFDAVQQRATVWSIAGAPGRTVKVLDPPEDLHFFALRGPLEDGRLVWSSPLSLGPSPEPQRVPETILVTSRTGVVEQVFGSFPGSEQSERKSRFDLGVVPFTSELFVGVRGSEILLANSRRLVISIYDPAGGRRGAFGARVESVPVSDEWIRLDAERKRAWYGSGPMNPLRADRLAGIDGIQYPDSFPVFSAMEVADDGGVWTAAYALPQDSASGPDHLAPATISNLWYVFDGSGAPLGTVTFPDRLRVLDVSDDLVAGVWRDELDVEQVRIYRLTR